MDDINATGSTVGDGDSATSQGPTGDPDIDSSLELIISTFPDEASADAAFNQVRDAEKAESFLLVDAAVVNRDDSNNLHVKEEQDWSGRVGALVGAGIGGILGMLGGPLGLVVGGAAGAAIGAAAAAGKDSGIHDEKLKELAANLRPRTSMVILVVAHFWSVSASDLLRSAGGDVTTTPLTAETARQLNLGTKT